MPGLANGQPAILLILTRQPNANIVETVARVRAALPQIRASIPATIDLNVMLDRTPTIRASLREVERTLRDRDPAGGAGHLRVSGRLAIGRGLGGRGAGIAARHLRA